MSPPRGIQYLDSLPFWDGQNFCPIETPRRLLELLGNPQDSIASIHVAGTNGKGSVSSYLASLLRASGAQVGQFASPHLSHVTERCIINGRTVDEALFGEAVKRVVALAREENLEPSYFVLGAIAAFLIFEKLGLDWMVIEAGLGGRLDATNVMRAPRVSVITSIGLDHTHILGDTLALIAREKAGIVKPRVPVFVGEVSKEARDVIQAEAEKVESSVEFLNEDFIFDQNKSVLCYSEGTISLNMDAPYAQASYKLINALLSARVGAFLGFSQEVISKGLEVARWPGRLEELSVKAPSGLDHRRVLLDSAHNRDGMEVLCNYLFEKACARQYKKLVFVLSFLARKDWKEMLKRLSVFAESLETELDCETEFVFTDIGAGRSVLPSKLCEVQGAGVAVESPENALRQALEMADKHTLLVVTGSIFLVGRLRPQLTDAPFQTIDID